jgi:hypothetical protein
MALDAAKWQVNTDKSIEYIGGDHGTATANYVTVLELHRWLQDLADDASVLDHGNDDFMDITTLNPSDKSFDTIINLVNGYYLDELSATPAVEFVYGGSIIQNNGSGEQIFDGIKVVATEGCVVNVIQDNTVLSNKFWNSTPNGETLPGINRNLANGVCMQFMVKVKDSGANIDNTSLIFTTREWGYTYSEFRIPATGRGENTVPLTYAEDLNNATVIGDLTSAPFTGISNTNEGYILIDLQNGDGSQGYYSAWDRGSATINQFYEYMKYITRNGETTTLYGLAGERFRGITHQVAYSSLSGGTFADSTSVSWGSGATAGTGQILADDGSATMWIQLLTGAPPVAALTLTQGGVTATSGTITERTLSTPMCGASTGSSLVGAYGFNLEYADLSVNDKMVALDGTTRQPPNNVQFTVGGIASGYRVLVGPEDGANGLKYDQLSNTSLLNGATVTAVQVDEAIPANTPSPTGTIRIQRADGQYTRHPYSAVDTGTRTFTITSHDFSGNNAAAGANVFISYIDDAASGTTISFNTVQTVTQTLYVEARFGGTGPDYTDAIKPARSTGTLGSTGGSATLSPVSDA